MERGQNALPDKITILFFVSLTFSCDFCQKNKITILNFFKSNLFVHLLQGSSDFFRHLNQKQKKCYVHVFQNRKTLGYAHFKSFHSPYKLLKTHTLAFAKFHVRGGKFRETRIRNSRIFSLQP